MLNTADNDVLCRVGPGTPMGTLLREYWIPSTVPSDLLPSPDCPPVRIRLLGENLIAFRTTSGQPGLVANACPHRGASMFFGRNEEEGLRCVYHGWKFDVAGDCVDMPSEPPESNFKSKVKIRAYPCREINGMIWTYMGPRETPPALPDFEFITAVPENCFYPKAVFYDCNWAQALEGDIDSSHIDYLHSRLMPEPVENADLWAGGFFNRDRTPDLSALPMPYGAIYSAKRRWDDEGRFHHRISQFCMPFYTMVAGGGPSVGCQAWVPLDDEHTVQIAFRVSLRGPAPEASRVRPDPYALLGGYAPGTSDPLTRWRSLSRRDNDYMIDRDVQRTKTFSGIPNPGSGKLQDMAMTESMGYIYDRTSEHLGRSDSMIIVFRKVMLQAAKALQDGVVHETIDQPELFRVRSVEIMLPEDADWLEMTERNRSSDSGVRLKHFVTAELI